MAKRQITDEEDRLKRQARRRLIGAVALTTAVVVILPMIMDREPRPAGQNIELKIPDKDSVDKFAPKIDIPPAAPVSAVAASALPPVEMAASAVAPPPVSAVAVAPAPAVPEAKPAPEPAKTEIKPAPPPPAAPAHKEAAAKKETKPAPAKHAGKSSAKLSEQGEPLPTSGFVLQIGAFNNANTAHSWMGNLKLQGFNAYTEKLGDKTRVRVGPYSTHAAAIAASKKIEKTQGLHSNIINLK